MVEVGEAWWRLRFPPPTFTNLDQPPPSFCSFPAPQTADKIVEHQKLLVDAHALPLAAELAEQLAQADEPRHVEPERLGKIFLRMRPGIGADVIGERRRDAATFEVHPVLVHHAVGFTHLAEGTAEAAGARPRPVVIEE